MDHGALAPVPYLCKPYTHYLRHYTTSTCPPASRTQCLSVPICGNPRQVPTCPYMPDQAYYCAVDEPHIINSIVWVGSWLKDLRSFPAEVKDVVGFALYQAQVGRKAPLAKPLAGFGGASVIEIVEDYQSDTYRAVYTVRFSGVVYVLHVFQKKSKKGVATPKPDMELIRKRLKVAEEDYRKRETAGRHE